MSGNKIVLKAVFMPALTGQPPPTRAARHYSVDPTQFCLHPKQAFDLIKGPGDTVEIPCGDATLVLERLDARRQDDRELLEDLAQEDTSRIDQYDIRALYTDPSSLMVCTLTSPADCLLLCNQRNEYIGMMTSLDTKLIATLRAAKNAQ